MRPLRAALVAAVLGVALVAARGQDDEPKPNPFVLSLKAAVAKGGRAFLAESKDGKVEVSVWKDDKAWTVTVDLKTQKAQDPKEAAKDSDAANDGADLGPAVAKAKVQMPEAVEKALQGEEKIDVELAQALKREKALLWVVQLKKAGVGSSWEVDAETGKVSQAKAPGAMGEEPK
jgi:hypothetical protein